MTNSMIDTLAGYRLMSVVPTTVDTLGLAETNPGSFEVALAQITYEVTPFARMIKDVDAFFGDDLVAALTGAEAAGAEAEVRRIMAEHLAAAIMRLALSAAAGAQVDWINADTDTLRHLAGVALQRAADQRFVTIVHPGVHAVAAR